MFFWNKNACVSIEIQDHGAVSWCLKKYKIITITLLSFILYFYILKLYTRTPGNCFSKTTCLMIQFHLKWHIPWVLVLCPEERILLFKALAGSLYHTNLAVDYSDSLNTMFPRPCKYQLIKNFKERIHGFVSFFLVQQVGVSFCFFS